LNISIIIFCHNEKDNIEKVVLASQRVAKQIAVSCEIIVVDDGSTDGTVDKIKKMQNVRCVLHSANKGIGMALRSGYTAASKEYVCAVPGDGQFDVNELLGIKPFGFDTFYSYFRPATNYNPYRKFLNLSNRLFNNFLLGIKLTDVNWIKVYRKDQLDFVQMEMHSSIVESEICAKLMKAGCVPIELPSVYHERKSGASKGGSWKTLRQVIVEMLSLYLLIRKFDKKI